MRKHVSYYYKSYDNLNFSEIERITNSCFNEYGYNLDSNKRHELDYDALFERTNCQNLKKLVKPKKN